MKKPRECIKLKVLEKLTNSNSLYIILYYIIKLTNNNIIKVH